ncbi:MAG: zinc ribbon domain-containing protein [Chloroflexi bacterium AL-W]|nr:zinc ribbon domain-containing protein [Chloroflexi bacterium AL-N1]NOK70679.1 zinc ribbon domain-containing protein [Chloroflexi bacterium AL-N10]NOK78498.1 zinc ribbon domain-containing protein [Chloroflexi bacterium AL-N5]NOK85582.1 zinc ribbon domain-containing protein [Chloroflexi bacterium AL-W]NOK92496.1 zinc ribbon domain-containing protein [Chloroflexi bacterium AL-N15]
MVERICPTCQHGNLLESRFCNKCGAALEWQLPARRGEFGMTIAGRQLPVTWQQFGKTVAISAAALAAEVGIAWLRRRIEAGSNTTTSSSTELAARSPTVPTTTFTTKPQSNVTIMSQRVVDIFDNGSGERRIVERTLWQRIEE